MLAAIRASYADYVDMTAMEFDSLIKELKESINCNIHYRRAFAIRVQAGRERALHRGCDVTSYTPVIQQHRAPLRNAYFDLVMQLSEAENARGLYH